MPSRDSVPGLGAMLRAAREAKQLTQVQAAALAGVHQTTLTLYEQEKKTPGIAVLRRLAKAYGVSIAALVPENGDGPVAKPKRKKGG